MLPSSHDIPINPLDCESFRTQGLLADAFAEFISASSVLEASYRDLQLEVSHLGSELAQRNAALTRSLAENDRMRAALQQILDSLPCGVLVIDSASRIAMINPEGRKLLELGEAEINSLRELSRISQIDFEFLGKGPDGESDREVCIKSGTEARWVAIGHRKLLSDGPDLAASRPSQLQSIWILRDITTNKLAEQERETARRASVLAEISTILAHEIRNPLASMELFADLIANDRGDTSQWIAHLRAGIRTLSGTVNNVLSLNGETRPPLVSVNLAECVQTGVEFVRPIAEQAGVSLSFIAAKNSPIIHGNDDAIRQIVLNIVCNAVRHTAAGGRIDVSTQAGVKTALVKIADTGCGIPDHVIEHIFEAGFSASGENPGLGLAVCKRLMDQHQGTIRVSSRINHGTTFQLEFPIA